MTRTADRTRVAEFLTATEDLLGGSAQKTGGRVQVVDGALVAEDLRYHTHRGEVIVSAAPSGVPMLFDQNHRPMSTYAPELDIASMATGSTPSPMSLKAQRMVNPYLGAAWARWRLAQAWDYFIEMVTPGKVVAVVGAGGAVTSAGFVGGAALTTFFPMTSFSTLTVISMATLTALIAVLLFIGATFRQRLFKEAVADLRGLGAAYLSDFDLSTPHATIRRQLSDLAKLSTRFILPDGERGNVRARRDALQLFDESVMGSARVLHEGKIRHAYITTAGYLILDSAEVPVEVYS